MGKFEQFMLLVLLCTCVFWMVFEYNNHKLAELERKRQRDEEIMRLLKREPGTSDAPRHPRRYPIY